MVSIGSLLCPASGANALLRVGAFLVLASAAALGAETSIAARALTPIVAPLPAAREPAADVTFVVSGDSRPSERGAPIPRAVSTIFAEIGMLAPDFVLWTGDTIYGYGDECTAGKNELAEEHDRFAAIAAGGRVSVFDTPGNHEIPQSPQEPCTPAQSEAIFGQRYGALYGSFDFAGLHFISLDSSQEKNRDRISGEQLRWLQADLEAHAEARAIFVFTHTEFFSAPEMDPEARDGHQAIVNARLLDQLFQKYPVRAVFSGH